MVELMHRAVDRLHERRGWPLAVLRPCWELERVNGPRLREMGRTPRNMPGEILALSYRGELRPNTAQVLSHLVDPRARIVWRTRVTDGEKVEQFEARGVLEHVLAVELATVAAMRHMGLPLTERGEGAEIVSLAPWVTGLALGEIVVRCDGTEVSTAPQLVELLSAREAADVQLVAPGRPAHSVHLRRRGVWGLGLRTFERRFDGLRRLSLAASGAAGPSAGLAIGLAAVEALGGRDVARGRRVAVTGTCGPTGQVEQVGGVMMKARAAARAGVDVLVVPAGPDILELRGRMPNRALLEVSSLDEALDKLTG